MIGVILLLFASGFALGEEEKVRQGRLITLSGTVDSALSQQVLDSARLASREGVDVLILDLKLTPSDFGVCWDLAQGIVRLGGSIRTRVAYVSQDLTGHGVLLALACDEIVMAPGSHLGPAADPTRPPLPAEIELYRQIARDKGHSIPLAAALIDPSMKLYQVEVPNQGGKQFVDQEKLEEFQRRFGQQQLSVRVVKEAGQPLRLDAEQAKSLGLVSLVAESRSRLATRFGLDERIVTDDPLDTSRIRAAVLKLEGVIDTRQGEYVRRRLRAAQAEGLNLLFVEMDTATGRDSQAMEIANALRAWPGRKIAWIPKQCLGPGTLMVLGCDDLVVGPDATIGSFQSQDTSEQNYAALANSAADLARDSRFHEALARGLVDPATEVFEVRNRKAPAVRSFRTADDLAIEEIAAEWEKARPGPVKPAGVAWRLSGKDAASLDLASRVANSRQELVSPFGLSDSIRVLQPDWIDWLVHVLTGPGGTIFLLSAGMICLYLELQMPGFGIPGVLSAICFVLFFWSRFLAETAGSLELILFLLGVGLVCVELFVTPGLAVPGIAGMIMIASGLILAGSKFTIPQSPAETRELLANLTTFGASLVVFIVGAVVVARFVPRTPFFHRLVLQPPEAMPEEPVDFLATTHELVGKVGEAVTPLRPAGRIRIDNEYHDVVAQGDFIDQGAAVEVVEVYQTRTVVRETNRA